MSTFLTATTSHHPDCDKCDRSVRSAVAHARVTGSVGCTYDDDGHRAVVIRRGAPVEALSDQQLWLQFMIEDREMAHGTPDDERHAELDAEIARRFGTDATERTAEWAVATHMSSDDLVRWADENYGHLANVANGTVSFR